MYQSSSIFRHKHSLTKAKYKLRKTRNRIEGENCTWWREREKGMQRGETHKRVKKFWAGKLETRRRGPSWKLNWRGWTRGMNWREGWSKRWHIPCCRCWCASTRHYCTLSCCALTQFCVLYWPYGEDEGIWVLFLYMDNLVL